MNFDSVADFPGVKESAWVPVSGSEQVRGSVSVERVMLCDFVRVEVFCLLALKDPSVFSMSGFEPS